MDEKVLLALEFDRVLALLAAETATPQGARVAAGLRPSSCSSKVADDATSARCPKTSATELRTMNSNAMIRPA